MQEIQERPWYRQFWPWFIMAFPAASVVGGLLTFYLAGGEPAMVVDDYGRIAMVTARRAERTQRAADLGLSARLTFMAESGIQVALEQNAVEGAEGPDYWPENAVEGAEGPDYWPGSLLLELVHPTRSELDREVELAGSLGRYAGDVDRPPGRYYVLLSDASGTWRLTGELADGAAGLELDAGVRSE